MINRFPASTYETESSSFEMTSLTKNKLTTMANTALSQTDSSRVESHTKRALILLDSNFDDHTMIELVVENIKKFVASTHFTRNTRNELGEYTGRVANGKPEGAGKIKVPLGEYTGDFVDGLPQGESGIMKTYGSTIEGSFFKGFPHGKGKAAILNYYTLMSKIKNSYFDPEELIDLPRRDSYEGVFEMGKYHGVGKYIWEDGSSYDGQWKKGKMDGQGTFKYSNGNSYAGEWKKGEKEGQGTYKWVNGDCYTGQWKNGKKDGQGTLTWNIGDSDSRMDDEDDDILAKSYEGEWKNDEMHGQGKMIYEGGTVIKGKFENGNNPSSCVIL